MHKYKGAIVAHIGPMFGGKTSGLLADVRKMRIAGYNVGLFKPKKDDRYSANDVVNHDGESISAINIKSLKDIIEESYIDKYDVIAIDEFQFLELPHYDYIYVFINYLISTGKTLIISGLDLDSELYPFKNVKDLLPYATHIFKHKAVCVDCGNDATTSYCLVEKEGQELIGADEAYIPLCIHCYNKRKYGEKSEL